MLSKRAIYFRYHAPSAAQLHKSITRITPDRLMWSGFVAVVISGVIRRRHAARRGPQAPRRSPTGRPDQASPPGDGL